MSKVLSRKWKVHCQVQSMVSQGVKVPQQKHTGRITTKLPDTADGILITHTTGPSGVRTADCLPLLLLAHDAVLALHVSRKTLVKGLLNEVPKYMNTNSVEQVFIGPHICAKHFVFPEKRSEIITFQEHFPFAVHDEADGTHLSLKKVVDKYLKEWNIPSEAVVNDNRCTVEDLELPSYYRNWHNGSTLGAHDHLITYVTHNG